MKYELIINTPGDAITLFFGGQIVEQINGVIPYSELHDLLSDWVKKPMLHEKSVENGVYIYEVSHEL